MNHAEVKGHLNALSGWCRGLPQVRSKGEISDALTTIYAEAQIVFAGPKKSDVVVGDERQAA